MSSNDNTAASEPKIRKFRLIRMRHGWPDKAMRYALSGAMSNKGVEAAEVEVLRQTERLQVRWRQTLPRLREAGLATLQSPLGFVYAMNCPPAAVVTDQTGLRCCQQHHFCPFCWSRRYAGETYVRFQSVLLTEQGQLRGDFALYESQSRRLYPRSAWKPEELLAWYAKYRANYIQPPVASLGGMSLCSLEPLDDEWLLHFRRLAIVPSGTTPAPRCRRDSSKLAIDESSRVTVLTNRQQALAAAVGRVASYPDGLLIEPAKLVMATIRARTGRRDRARGYRMSEVYGIVRAAKAATSATQGGTDVGNSNG